MAPAAYKDLCLDARDPVGLGRFWAAALGLEVVALVDGDVALRGPSPQHSVWITAAREPKTVKNRMHLDVYASSVDDLLALGATAVQEFPRWTVMADPEGGEFCAFVREQPPAYRLYEVVLDAADHRAVGRWWADLLGCGRQAMPLDGSSVDPEAGEPDSHRRCLADEGKDFVSITDIPGVPFEYLDVGWVPEPKAAKNRVHLHVVGDVAEIVARGATVLAEHPRWTVLADPEGNEFCAFPRTDE
jgi:hypothetical protein